MKENKKNDLVVYTAIFGKKDVLIEPRIKISGADLVCFTDQDFSSSVWQVKKVLPPVPGDPIRSARRYKILAHEYLSNYTRSIWVDGNMMIVGDVRALADHELSHSSIAVYDHAYSREFPLCSLFEGADFLIESAHRGKWQEDPERILKQKHAYQKKGYPNNNGLLWSCVLLRRHGDPEVKKFMTLWWGELLAWTRRDQMSFNYVAWETGVSFSYIREDAANNQVFRRVSHYLPFRKRWYSRMLGIRRRFRDLIGQ